MTNEELIVLIQTNPENKDELVDQLYQQVQKFIFKKAWKKSKSSAASFDDVFAAMNYGYMEAIRLFNPEKQVKFTTYLSLVIHSRVNKDLFRDAKAKKRQAEVISIQSKLKNCDDGLSIEDTIGAYEFEGSVDVLRIMEGYLKTCTERERYIIEQCVLTDKTQQEVAVDAGLSQNLVSRNFRRFKEYMRGEIYGQPI